MAKKKKESLDDNTDQSKEALEEALKAHEASSKTTRHPDDSTDAHEASKRAHHLHHRTRHLHGGKVSHLAQEAHSRAAEAHEQAADKHEELSDDNPDDSDNHDEAAKHHRKAQDHHEDCMRNTTNNCDDDHDYDHDHDQNSNDGGTRNVDPTANAKKFHRMSDGELDNHHKELLAEKNRRSMNDFMGLTYLNPGEETPSARAGEATSSMPIDDVDWESEFEGVGLSHNAATEAFLNGRREPKSIMDQLFASTNPKDRQYQEAVRNAATIVNRERGSLLQRLTANMDEKQKHYTLNKFGNLPIEDLRQMVDIFSVNSQSPIGLPPLIPTYAGAGGGPVDNVSHDQQFGADAALIPPVMNFKSDSKEHPASGNGKRSA